MIGPRHLILVGLPGAGKSTVARRAAELLGAPCHDLDAIILSQVEESTISELFARRGEAAFRDLERAALMPLLPGTPSVIAAGGGWAAQEGNLAAVESQALTIYLAVPPHVAAARIGDATDRPLVRQTGASGLMALLAERERWYRLAGVEIEASGAPALVAEGVVTAARQYAGW